MHVYWTNAMQAGFTFFKTSLYLVQTVISNSKTFRIGRVYIELAQFELPDSADPFGPYTYGRSCMRKSSSVFDLECGVFAVYDFSEDPIYVRGPSVFGMLKSIQY